MSGGNRALQAAGDKTSTKLVLLIKVNDPRAWDRFFLLYAPLVYAWCRRGRLQPADARDVCQEVFAQVARKVADFCHDEKVGTLRGWLRTITLNKVREFARRARAEPRGAGGGAGLRALLSLPASLHAAGQDGEAGDRALLFRRAAELVRAGFEERTWAAFWRTAVGRERAADVAADLGMSANAVYLARSRVSARIREEFAALLGPAGDAASEEPPDAND
jgi:RNA polymerase sigma-70 factor (ECF subfamily)